jgi:hypothetical protein
MSDILTARDPIVGYEAIGVSGHRPMNELVSLAQELWKKRDAAFETMYARYKRGEISEDAYLKQVVRLDDYRETAVNLMDMLVTQDETSEWAQMQVANARRLLEEEL